MTDRSFNQPAPAGDRVEPDLRATRSRSAGSIWLTVPAHARARPEHLCRQLLRPPLALERLSESSHGQLLYELAHPRADGSTPAWLDPLELIEKLCGLVPGPAHALAEIKLWFSPGKDDPWIDRSPTTRVGHAREPGDCRARRGGGSTSKPSTR